MIDFRRLWLVAAFELRDAMRSKLAIIIVVLFAAGSALGSAGFIKSVQGAESAARNLLAEQAGIDPEMIPLSQVRTQALTLLFSFVKDEELRNILRDLQPLAIFFGYASLQAVPLLVLTLSAGSHAADIQNGTARFSLFRCNRPTWALGKMLGHAGLLGVGLLVGALVAGSMGFFMQPEFEPRTLSDLLIAAVRTWLYGLTYLAVFSGLSLIAGTPMKARALCLAALIASGVGHLIFRSDSIAESAPPLAYLKWLFPGQHELSLWMTTPLTLGVAVAALLAIGAAGLSLGISVFDRRDA